MPSVEFRLITARYLNELGLHKLTIKVLEMVIGESDENVEAWYLLAFSMFKLKKFQTTVECCKNVRNLAEKFKIVDAELQEATEEIYAKTVKEL